MINPTHLIKKLPNGFNYKVPYINRHEEVVWLTHNERGWLGSGVKDKNGREIYEGDIVQIETFEKVTAIVEFHDGAFWLGNRILADLPVIYYPTLEVVGHIATEEDDNDNRT